MLVTLSFWWYGLKTEQLVFDRDIKRAEVLVDSNLVPRQHLKSSLSKLQNDLLNELSDDASSINTNPGFKSRIIYPSASGEEAHELRDPFERQALAQFLAAAAKQQKANPEVQAAAVRKPKTFADGQPTQLWSTRPGRSELQYVEAVLYKPTCLINCHPFHRRPDADGKYPAVRPYDLASVVGVTLPLGETNKSIHRNRAILISTALVTAIMAMIISYVIVRYVIVKPLKHLRDVSDAISAGKLNIRSQIHTGDEFEELSHAFNRMLHNLVAMQQELRDVNGDLDKKVDELAQANLALFEMNRIKSDFLATMSHELRTPLNSIIGFSEVLSTSDQLSDRQRRYAANIQNSGKMLLGMINDILDLAKIESGKMEVHVEDFSVRDVCEALANLVRPIADKKNLDLRCELDEAIPLLHQDPNKIKQVLYNLLSNAIKFTPEGGRVVLSARAEGRHVVLSVVDTGIGIPEDDRERVFEKFRQAGLGAAREGVLTREHAGTGLGLSIVRELTRLLGGDVTLESEVGRGSTFTVRLPMQLTGHRTMSLNLAEQGVDLSKARRIEGRALPAPHLASQHMGEPAR